MALFSLQGPLPIGPLGRKGRSPTPTPMKPWSPLDGMMLSIAYSGDVPAALVEVVEHHARGQGLSLQALEVIGASLDHVEAFIVACEDGDAEAFLVEMGLMAPRERVALARWQAERLFG